jgi:methionine-S-sulfoxide reductase
MEKKIYFAGGCFWGMEAFFKPVKGVLATRVGYANGTTAFPKYEDLKKGKADHAETLQISYDDEAVSLTKLLELYLRVVDPYSIDQQGNSVAFFDLVERKRIELSTSSMPWRRSPS